MKKRRNELTRISDLFAKYKNTLHAPQASVIEAFVGVVEDVCGVTLSAKSVRYAPASKTLSVQASGPLKSEIQLHRQEILLHLKGRLGERNAPEHIV